MFEDSGPGFGARMGSPISMKWVYGKCSLANYASEMYQAWLKFKLSVVA